MVEWAGFAAMQELPSSDSEMKFKVGDKVRVVSSQYSTCEHIGVETTVLATCTSRKGRTMYNVDLPPSRAVLVKFPQQKSALFRESDLKHVYDGHEKATWDACVWQPNKVTV